jgi:hypothetical protein
MDDLIYPSFLNLFCFVSFWSNFIMTSVRKISRREHSSKIIAVILTLRSLRKSYAEISDHVKLSRSSVFIIIHRQQRLQNCSTVLVRFTKRVDRSLKLDAKIRQRLIRHVETNPRDDFATVTTSSKFTHSIHRVTIRSYLKIADYLRFKTRKKSFLTSKHKQTRLKWAREHVNWIIENWMHVIWTNEFTFETRLNIRSCYVSRRLDTVIKSRYLKFTFKSERFSVSIWEIITWNIKKPIHFLQKKKRTLRNDSVWSGFLPLRTRPVSVWFLVGVVWFRFGLVSGFIGLDPKELYIEFIYI